MSPEPDRLQARPGAVVLFGPTASGKSTLALRLAERYRGTIINADSMQLYRGLRRLTARPDEAAERRVPHRLYGILEPHESGSVGDWLDRVETVLTEVAAEGRMPVVVGGTGLYIRALLDGIAPVPPIPDRVRAEVRRLHERSGADGLRRTLHDRGAALEPARAGDPQRLMRALEVLLATGRPLRAWQAEPRRRLVLPAPVAKLALVPPRHALRARIEDRLRAMIEDGALGEVEAFRRLGVEPGCPVMKAVALRELIAYQQGAIDLESALRRAIVQTRRYAKRQVTWLRHRMADFELVPGFGDSLEPLATRWPHHDGAQDGAPVRRVDRRPLEGPNAPQGAALRGRTRG